MLAFPSVDEAIASGFAKIETSHFDNFKGFDLVCVPTNHRHVHECAQACLVAQAVYSPLVLDVLQLEIDGCAKHDHFQVSQLSECVFGSSVPVLIGSSVETQETHALFSPTNLLKAITSFREAVELFYTTWPAAQEWERARMDAANALQSGKAAISREQSIRYALNIRKKFGFENLEAKYQKLLKDNGLA